MHNVFRLFDSLNAFAIARVEKMDTAKIDQILRSLRSVIVDSPSVGPFTVFCIDIFGMMKFDIFRLTKL